MTDEEKADEAFVDKLAGAINALLKKYGKGDNVFVLMLVKPLDEKEVINTRLHIASNTEREFVVSVIELAHSGIIEDKPINITH